MTAAEIITAMVAAAGLVLGLRAYFRDKEMEQRLLPIEEEAHARKQEERDRIEAWQREAEEARKSANFAIRLRMLDGQAGEVFAMIVGPAIAEEVELEVWRERGGDRLEIPEFPGDSDLRAERLLLGKTVHAHIADAIGLPSRNELRYRISWTDQRGPQEMEGRVPLD